MTTSVRRTGARSQYLPDLATHTPSLDTTRTRIPLTNPARRPNEATNRVRIEEAFDWWAAAGSAANVAMQLGWPEVAYGVMESKVESGSLMKHPWKRLRTTEQYLAVALMGTDEERAAYREAVNSAHRHVRSDEQSPVKYNAFDRELQLWVAACLFVGFEDTNQMLYGRMDDEQAEQFYQGASALATTLQVPQEMWPATRADFDHYWNTACERVSFDDTQKQFINDLINLKMVTPLFGLPARGLLRFLTIGFLPPLFRERLGLEWRAVDQRRFDNLFRFVGTVNRFLPAPLRLGPFWLIMRDLRGRIRKGKALV